MAADPIRPAVQNKLRRSAPSITFALLAVTAIITFGEIDRLIAGSIGSDGRPHPLTTVIGPGALGQLDVWSIWAEDAIDGQIGTWILWSTIVDFALIAGYYFLFARAVRRYAGPRRALRVFAGVDVVENILLVIGALILVGNGVPGTAFAWIVALVATAKFLGGAAFVFFALWNRACRRALGRFLKSVGWSLWIHRLSTVLLVALVILACIPSGEVLDQLPDLQRQWVDSGDNFTKFLWAVLGLLAAASSFFVLGRQRADRIRRSWVQHDPPSKPGRVLLWLIGPALVGIPALIALIAGRPWDGSPVIAIAFFTIPLLLVGGSLLLRWLRPNLWKWPGPQTTSRRRPIWVWAVGDVLSLLVLAVGGLGLVRSFAGPLFLDLPGGLSDVGAWPGAVFMFLLGVVGAVLAPQLARGLARPQSERTGMAWEFWRQSVDPDTPTPTTLAHRLVRAAVFAVGVIFLVAVILFPVAMGRGLGAVALTIGIITAWIMVLGSFTVIIQRRLPIEVFRLLHLKAAPVLTMAVVLPLVIGIAFASFGSVDSSLHAARTDDRGVNFAPQRSSALAAWLARDQKLDDPCVIRSGGQLVQPVYLVAAEGGGIRAAYWTSSVLDALGDQGDCVMVSSGVSGGSIGLTVARTSDGDARPVVQLLAHPDTLSVGVAGLLAGDLVAGATGVHPPSWVGDEADRGWRWRDRAALIEGQWIRLDPALGEPFTAELGAPTGALILNSTDSVSKCRILVTQYDPDSELADATKPPLRDGNLVCDRPTQLSSSVTLSAAYRGDCLGDLDWATAALFSGRFPIITPAGAFPVPGSADCASGPELQLIDGGYAEGSGLATMADLAPEFAQIITEYNATADGRTVPFAVPILVFARNGVGFDLVEQAGDVSAEALVPLAGYSAKKELADHDAWIQRIITAMADVCETGTATAFSCERALDPMRSRLPGGVVIVAPSTRPTIAPPLGWALSCYSQLSLQSAIEKAKTEHRVNGRFARLGDLYDYVGVEPTATRASCTPLDASTPPEE